MVCPPIRCGDQPECWPMIDPAESEPDGDRFLGHHFWIGIAVMIVGWMQWTPGGTAVIGSHLTFVGLLIVLDDLISHFFGVWTPLDYLFKRFIAK